jgi:ABC-2 type transport system permease protein
MINSLPLGRNQIVKAKYLSSLIFGLAMMVVALPISFLISYTGFPGTDGMSSTLAVRFVMISLFFISLYLSIFFPVYFKFGYLKSRWANVLSFFVIFGLVGFVGGRGEYIPQYGDMLSRESTLQQFLGILAGSESLTVYLTILALGFLILYLSLRFSISIYKKKEF